MNLNENIIRIKQVMGIIIEQTDLSQYETQLIPLEDDNTDDTYMFAKVIDGKLIGKLKNGTKQEILPNNPKYKKIIGVMIKQKSEVESPTPVEGPIVDGAFKDGTPTKVDLGKLTSDDINRVYKYSLEYKAAFMNHRKTSNDIFCAGDVFDISSAVSDVNKIRECGAPSFDNIVPNKLKNYKPFVQTILFLVDHPNDPRAVQIKKNMGITI
jgi:hypothetical protein